MEELFRKDFPEGEFASWDWWYYAEKVRKQKYALDEEMLRPYFSLENVQGWPPPTPAARRPPPTAGQSLFAASSASPFLLETTAPRVFPGRGKFVSRYAP